VRGKRAEEQRSRREFLILNSELLSSLDFLQK
jgi:hypothetical protein